MTQPLDSESARLFSETDAPGVPRSEALPYPPSPNSSANVVNPQPTMATTGEEEPPVLPTSPNLPEFSRPATPSSALGLLDQPKPEWLLLAIALTLVGLVFNQNWITLVGAITTLLYSVLTTLPFWRSLSSQVMNQPQVLALLGFILVGISGLQLGGFLEPIRIWTRTPNWDAIGALGDAFGAVGQILIALLALWVAWRQYVIEKDLTTRQNIITQQQTIDTYFQGISDLVIDDEGLLEDWPQERAIAEGRTAAILASIDGQGKAKVLRFLSHSGLLTPLKRDRRLGRAILDGAGGYQEDRSYGIRVIDLRGMLANADLAGTDLRWIDLSDANLVNANLSGCDLVRSNLSRTILYQANLMGADLEAVRLFYGTSEQASPRSRTEPPHYGTGICTGAVVEGANLTKVKNLSEEQRYYCCAWGGSATRLTVPGGCEGIPNKLGR